MFTCGHIHSYDVGEKDPGKSGLKESSEEASPWQSCHTGYCGAPRFGLELSRACEFVRSTLQVCQRMDVSRHRLLREADIETRR